MSKENEIKKTIEKLNKYFVYAEKRLAIHEASHVVFAYLMGHSCHYMQTGLQRDVAYKNGNLEIDAQSVSQIYNIFPPFLDRALQLLTVGNSIQSISKSADVSSEMIKAEIKKHIIVLLSGYEAENHFYNGIKYWFIKRIPLKYSIDMTPSDFRHDNTKINFFANQVGVSNAQIGKLKKLITNTLNNKKIKSTCFALSDSCLEKTRLSQQEIEAILLETGFNDIKQQISEKFKAEF